MRQLAWLNATPKPPEGSKRAKLPDQSSKLSRLDRLKKDGVTPPMPPNPAPEIIAVLIELGITEAAGMGSAPISWREIVAWQEAMGIPLPPWQARLLRRLSTEYLAEGRRAESENCPPPWHAPPTKREQDLELKRLKALLG